MARIVINGATYHGSGKNISIVNGKVTIDGRDVTPDSKEITIAIDGNVEELSVDACSKVNINGACGQVQTMSGNIKCGAVNGAVQTSSGDVECGHVQGGVTTSSGDVDCKVVCGSIRTSSGDVDHVKIGDDNSFRTFVALHAPDLIEQYEKVAQGA